MIERLQIKVSERKAWLDGELLDLTPQEFTALLMLAEARKSGTDYVTPQRLQAALGPEADVDGVMDSLAVKLVRS